MLKLPRALRPLLCLCLFAPSAIACDAEDDRGLSDADADGFDAERLRLTKYSTSIASWDQSVQDLRATPRDLDEIASRCENTELKLDYPSGTVLRFSGQDITRTGGQNSGCLQYWNSNVDLGDDPSTLSSLHLPAPTQLDSMLSSGWTVQTIWLRTQSGSSFECGYNTFEPASGPYGERHRVWVEVLLRKGSSYSFQERWIISSDSPDIELRWTECTLPTAGPGTPIGPGTPSPG